jgi:recombination protein RecT
MSTDLEDQIFSRDETMAHQAITVEAAPVDDAPRLSRLDALEHQIADADDIPPAHEPEGRADEDMGEANSDSELPAWWNLVEGLKANIDAAATNAAIKAADDVFVKNAAGLPDDVAEDLQTRIAEARRRVKPA